MLCRFVFIYSQLPNLKENTYDVKHFIEIDLGKESSIIQELGCGYACYAWTSKKIIESMLVASHQALTLIIMLTMIFTGKRTVFGYMIVIMNGGGS